MRLSRTAAPPLAVFLLAVSLVAGGCGAAGHTTPAPAAAPSELTPAWTLRYASATLQVAGIPTIGGRRLLVSGPTGNLTAYDLATGRRLWHRQVVPDTSELPGPPLIVGSRVLIMAGTSLAAYALASGKLLWQVNPRGLVVAPTQPLPFAGLIVLPAVGLPLYDPATGKMVRQLAPGLRPWPELRDLAVNGAELLVVTADGTVRAYDEGGRLLWTARPPSTKVTSAGSVALQYVGVDAGSAGVALGIEGVTATCPTCRDTGTVRAVGLAPATGQVLWIQARGIDLPVVAATGVPVAVEAGLGVAISLADGHVLWQFPQQQGLLYTSLDLVDGRLLAFDPAHGRLLLVDPQTGHIVAKQSVPYAAGRTASLDARPHLAVGAGYAVVTTSDGHLVAFRLG